MAEDKKGFILYADQKEIFELLPLEKRGELITIIFSYVNDENPEVADPLINMAFTLIKQVLKRDLKKYEIKKEQYSIAGKKSAEARRLKKEQESTNPTNVKIVKERSTNPTVIVKDNVIVNVKDKVKDIKTNIEFDLFWNLYDKKVSKTKSENKWDKLTDKEREDIIAYLPSYIKSTPDVKFRKNPETFFNNKSWLDELPKGSEVKTSWSIDNY
tara:strand:- start:1527 stop:2168 length:642 start_codon:yes stop_codon:yes gene_type:complete